MSSGVIRYWGHEFQVTAGPSYLWVDVWGGIAIFPNGQTWETKEVYVGLEVPQDGAWHTIALQLYPVDSGGWTVRPCVLPGLSYDYDYDKVVLAQARWERGYIDCQDRRRFVSFYGEVM